MSHKETGYNFAAKIKHGIDPDTYAAASVPYKAAVRIVNVLEDLHAQMQKPSNRFENYPIEDFEEIDTYIRDNMANLALSIETRALSERNSHND